MPSPKKLLLTFLLAFCVFFQAALPILAQNTGTYSCSFHSPGLCGIINNCQTGYQLPNPNVCSLHNGNAAQCNAIVDQPCTAQSTTLPQGTWYNPTLKQFEERVFQSPDDEIFGERYTFAQVVWIIHSLSLIIRPRVDVDSANGIKDLLSNNTPRTPQFYAKFGLPSFFLGTMAELYRDKPLSGVREISQTLAKFDLATPVNAQGYGYTNMSAIRILWSASRNTAYIFSVIILVIAGFLIMFRVKVNPQTTVTLQMMIPRIAIALIGITFSYALAGLAVDLTFVFVGFILAIFHLSAPNLIVDFPIALNFFDTPGYWKVFLTVLFAWQNYSLGNNAISFVFGALFNLILLIMLVFLLFRVWWMLAKTYVTFIILTILGPWIILLGLLPNAGNSVGLGGWFRNLFAQVAVFATVPFMFFLIFAFITPDYTLIRGWLLPLFNWITNNILNNGIAPGGIFAGNGPDPTLPGFPLFGFGQGLDMRFFLSFVILSMMPKAADMIRDAIKAPPFKYGSAFNEALGPIVTPLGGALSARGQRMEKTTGSGQTLTHAVGAMSSSVGNAIQRMGRG